RRVRIAAVGTLLICGLILFTLVRLGSKPKATFEFVGSSIRPDMPSATGPRGGAGWDEKSAPPMSKSAPVFAPAQPPRFDPLPSPKRDELKARVYRSYTGIEIDGVPDDATILRQRGTGKKIPGMVRSEKEKIAGALTKSMRGHGSVTKMYGVDNSRSMKERSD